jgi:hypothetical protein
MPLNTFSREFYLMTDTPRARLEAGMMADELRCFVRVARGDELPPPGARYEDGLQVQRWIEWLDAAANKEE